MEPSGRDADFRAHAELAAVGELGRGVVQHDRRIDLVEKGLGAGRVGGDDGIGVPRTVGADMRDRLVQAVDLADRQDGVEILRPPVLLRGRADTRIEGAGGLVAAQFAPGPRRGCR